LNTVRDIYILKIVQKFLKNMINVLLSLCESKLKSHVLNVIKIKNYKLLSL